MAFLSQESWEGKKYMSRGPSPLLHIPLPPNQQNLLLHQESEDCLLLEL